MKKNLKLEERLIVPADYNPREHGGIKGCEKKAMELARMLEGAGVPIKGNSILRAIGYSFIERLHDYGLKVFADLKLIDIPKTMEYDAEFLIEASPDILTVMCCAGVEGMRTVQNVIGANCEVLGVTVLTSLTDDMSQAIFTCSAEEGVSRFGRMAQSAGLGGLILSGNELSIIKSQIELTLSLNCPAIRPAWSLVEGDDQSRIMTPLKAIQNGAERIVVGRPIINAKDPRDAIKRTLEEINAGLEARENKGRN